jgi:tRNA(Ile)-lysidine synthase
VPSESNQNPLDAPVSGVNGEPFARSRWSQLGRSAGLNPSDSVLIALSGGADSVYLLHLLASSQPRPKLLAVHVEHGLRGGEGQEDSAFCARLCAKLGVPFSRRMLELDASASNLEARAREGRYGILAEEARHAGISHIVTGHHEDDALETLLMRMMRGSDLAGLPGLKNHFVLAGEPPVTVHRPLTSLRREEVRRLLRDAGHSWREDSSNAADAHTRNRVRNGLLPGIEASCGPQGLDGLRAFADAVESLEDELAQRTAHLEWDSPSTESAGSLARSVLSSLAEPLRRRALWRLIQDGTGLPPGRALLAILLDDLAQGRCGLRSLPGDWSLSLEQEHLHLLAPGLGSQAQATHTLAPLALPLPGSLQLPDGRQLSAEFVTRPPGSPVPQTANTVELDATGLDGANLSLQVRGAQPHDRFHGLGAPGSRPLMRFLADAGVPAEERTQVPLIYAGDELIWVAGLRPAESRRVTPGTSLRLRLCLKGVTSPEATPLETPMEGHRDGRRGQEASSGASDRGQIEMSQSSSPADPKHSERSPGE